MEHSIQARRREVPPAYYGHTRDDYLEAITASGLTILKVMDIPVGEAPDGYLPEEMLHTYAEKPLCLIILAQK
ncbi:MAG: hypothetical protein NVSMB27_22910 [Ktedonobacteraceae bacterium]